MIKVYWRPRRVSRLALLLIAVMSVVGFVAVEWFKVRSQQPYYTEKLDAANLCARAFSALKAERLRRGLAIASESDPTQSGLIGQLMTHVTSNTGSLKAKKTTINPNFAAVILHMLRRAGVEDGDAVAVSLSGSFPALNVATMAALETLKAKAIIVSSIAASQWGANDPDFLWPEWEKILNDRRIIQSKSIAASIGGIEDRGLGMTAEGRRTIVAAIDAAGIPRLHAKSYDESIEQRMALYRENAAGRPIKAFVNVGGGTTSVGTKIGKRAFRPGLNLKPPITAPTVDSVMNRFADEGVPVIHLVNIAQLAKRYGLPHEPEVTPQVGHGKVFVQAEYNHWLAGGALFAIAAALYAFLRSDIGYRIMQGARSQKAPSRPEPMV